MSPVQRCFRILNLVSLFVLAYGLPGWAEDLAIGVVEPQKVLDGTTAGKQVKDALADYVNARQRLIESEEQDINAMEEDLVKQGTALRQEDSQEKEAVNRQKLIIYQSDDQEIAVADMTH